MRFVDQRGPKIAAQFLATQFVDSANPARQIFPRHMARGAQESHDHQLALQHTANSDRQFGRLAERL